MEEDHKAEEIAIENLKKGIDPAGHLIMKQGAEGRLYISEIFGMKCVVKERFPKKYRVPSLDEKLTKTRIHQVRMKYVKTIKSYPETSTALNIKYDPLMLCFRSART
jgi:hypothetical protein